MGKESTDQMFGSFIKQCIVGEHDYIPMNAFVRKEIICKYRQFEKTSVYHERADEFLEGLQRTLVLYMVGEHYEAYEELCRQMDRVCWRDLIRPMPARHVFRGRKMEFIDGKYKIFKPEEMNHIPYEKRYAVSGWRFSYQGMPGFYASETEDVVKAELGSDLKGIQIAQFDAKRPENIRILDLSYFFEIPMEEMDKSTKQLFLRIWPLIVLCGLRFSYPEKDEIKFRQEYILPQLLLEVILHKESETLGGVDGIRYRSVHAMNSLWNATDMPKTWNNYVFPARDIGANSHSKFIMENFEYKSSTYLNTEGKLDDLASV